MSFSDLKLLTCTIYISFTRFDPIYGVEGYVTEEAFGWVQ